MPLLYIDLGFGIVPCQIEVSLPFLIFLIKPKNIE
jgi:hypothetical protein